MGRGWHGDSDGHRKAGRLGGLKSAQTRKRKIVNKSEEFGEQLAPDKKILGHSINRK